MSKTDYKEVETLRDEDGVVAIVTQKADTHHLSFSLAKVFERDGKFVHTGFLNRRHIEGVRRLLSRLEDYLDREADRTVAKRASEG
jgi:hypothetical protein